MSTPTKYVDALKQEKVEWPIKYGDFLNYYNKPGGSREQEHSFWSGFYSSRPDFKK